MADNLPSNQPSSQQSGEQPPLMNRWDERQTRRDERRAWREERRAARWEGSGAWIVGVVLILVGLIFLLQNFGIVLLGNWWALFILIPAVGAFASAWNMYRNSGNQFTPAVRGSLTGGIILTVIAAAFLFNLNWGLIWPFFLIIAGVAALLNAMPASRD